MHLHSQKARYFGYAIFGLCLFVLLFAAQVKLSQYRVTSQPPDPLNSSKLWLGGQKMELPATSPMLLLVCVAFLFSMALPLAVKTQPARRMQVQVVVRRDAFERHRFLRPPPSV
jgi:hypothetical protein